MKSLLRTTALFLLALNTIAVTVPANATTIGTLYSNGPAHLNDPFAWEFQFGNTLSASFSLAAASTVTGFEIGTWVHPGDYPTTVDWSITGLPGGTVFGTIQLSNTFLWTTNAAFCGGISGGCEVLSTVADIPPVSLPAGVYYLNLKNPVTVQGDPIYWDQNNGVGCTGDTAGGGCTSTTFLNGTLLPGVSLDPDIYGYTNEGGGATPEPSSLVLFGSGILGLGGVLRKHLRVG